MSFLDKIKNSFNNIFTTELSKRVVIGALLITLVVASVWIDALYLRIAIAGIYALSLYEWQKLVLGRIDFATYAQYLVGFVILNLVCIYLPAFFYALMLSCSIIWLAIATAMYINSPILTNKEIMLPIGALLISSALIGLGEAYPHHLIMILLAVAVDTCAYFAGKYLGKHYLAPSISPKKTWEGAFGGFLGSLILLVALKLTGFVSAGWVWLIIANLILTTLAIIGDLFESKMKRLADVKDSGNLLPGHGGVLDRIDALIAVVPFVFILNLL